MKPLFGLLNVDKPTGKTSRDVVNTIQRMVRPNKIGHAGTLDPLARGVLLVCLGRATRLVPFVQQQPKCYTGTFLLGMTSNTEDTEGEITKLNAPPRPEREAIEAVLSRFRGRIDQRPPAFSALKVNGRRAYDLARRGEPVTLAPRPVVIHRLEVVKYDYPELTLDVTCGSGTYIRSLGRDIAESVGTGSVMSALVRTAIGRFQIQQACQVDQLSPSTIESHLQPALMAVERLSRITLGSDEIDAIVHGREIDRASPLGDETDMSEGQEVAAVDRDGQLVAILRKSGNAGFRPVRVFPLAEDSSHLS